MSGMVEQWGSLAVNGKVPREAILAIEEAMVGKQLKNCEYLDHSEACPVTHHFAPGLYTREMVIPAGVVIVGKIHKHRHTAVLASGRVSVLTEDGIEEIEGPKTFVSPSGVKRVVFAHTDSVWITFHPSEETDLEKLEDSIIAPSFEFYDRALLEGEVSV
jgi:hypothetical protein